MLQFRLPLIQRLCLQLTQMIYHLFLLLIDQFPQIKTKRLKHFLLNLHIFNPGGKKLTYSLIVQCISSKSRSVQFENFKNPNSAKKDDQDQSRCQSWNTQTKIVTKRLLKGPRPVLMSIKTKVGLVRAETWTRERTIRPLMLTEAKPALKAHRTRGKCSRLRALVRR